MTPIQKLQNALATAEGRVKALQAEVADLKAAAAVPATAAEAAGAETAAEAAPKITSELTASGTAGSEFSYQIAASNDPTAFDASGLPNGLTVDTATGLISGTPEAEGDATISISATNDQGTGTADLVLTVAAAAAAEETAAAATAAAPSNAALAAALSAAKAISAAGLKENPLKPGESKAAVAPVNPRQALAGMIGKSFKR